MMDNWDGYGMMYGNQWSGLFSFIFMSLILAAIVLGAIVLLRHFPQISAPRGEQESSASNLLDQRYAMGEISQEEYRTIKKDLNL